MHDWQKTCPQSGNLISFISACLSLATMESTYMKGDHMYVVQILHIMSSFSLDGSLMNR